MNEFDVNGEYPKTAFENTQPVPEVIADIVNPEEETFEQYWAGMMP